MACFYRAYLRVKASLTTDKLFVDFPFLPIRVIANVGTFTEFLKASLTRANAIKLGCHEEDAEPGPFATAAIGAFR
jgi:hypothetical protein